VLAPSGALRAVTFDCWSTLIYEQDPARGFQLRVYGFVELLRAAGQDVLPAQAQLVLQQAWRRHAESWMAGQHSGAREVARWALEDFALAEAARMEQLSEILQGSLTEHGVVALDGAGETLEVLRSRGIRLALVCDTGLTPGSHVRALLRGAGLLPALEVLVFSDEVGVPKPDPRTFRAALDPLGIAARDAVHVGDLRRTDVAGARSVGMGTVRIRAHHDDQSELPEADAVAHSHAHLQRLLDLTE
jgi:putative hydrolase of the HAD superfamily